MIGILETGSRDLLKTMKIETMLEAAFELEKMNELADPRHLDTHVPVRFLPETHLKNGYKIIHVVRNPKDVMVSFFKHAERDKLCGPVGTWDDYFNQFLAGDGE